MNEQDHYLELVRPIKIFREVTGDDGVKRVEGTVLKVGTKLTPYMVDVHPKNELQRRTPIMATYEGLLLRLGQGVTKYHLTEAGLEKVKENVSEV